MAVLSPETVRAISFPVIDESSVRQLRLDSRPAWHRPTLLVCLTMLAAAPLGCGARSPQTVNEPGSSLPGDALGPHVRVVEAADRPRLQLVRRSGDPEGALAAAIYPEGGSRGSLALAALLETRLPTRRFVGLEVIPRGLAVLVVWPVASPERVPEFFEAVQDALLDSVKSDDAALPRAEALRRALVERAGDASPYDACLGNLGSEGKKPLEAAFTASELDDLRERSATARRVGWSALGEPTVLDRAAAFVGDSWPSGAPLQDDFEAGREAHVRSGAADRALRLGVRVSNSEQALAAAHDLRSENHALESRLRALDPSFVVQDVRVTLRPSGACLAVTLGHDSARVPDVKRWATASELAERELLGALRLARPADEMTLALLAPESAIEAAALAAWTAVVAPQVREEPRVVVELAAPASDRTRPSAAAWSEALTAASARSLSPPIPFETRSEVGQGEAWLLVASPCGTSGEVLEEAGLRALAVRSLASDFDGTDGVALEPFINADGLGLLAHAARYRGETEENHAARLARVVGRAFAGEDLDGRDVASERATQIESIGEEPGRALAVSIWSAGHTSTLMPFGTSAALTGGSTADLERIRRELVDEPLRASFLANGGRGQSRAAEDALSEWLGPFRQTPSPCPVHARPTPPSPGVWSLESVEPEVKPVTFVGFYRPAPRELGRALAFLLNRPGGPLARAVEAPGFALAAHAEWWGGPHVGGLVIETRAEPDKLAAAEQQVRGVLDALAKNGPSDADVERALAEFERLRRLERRSPRGRVAELWYGRTPVAPTRAALAEILSAATGDKHLVVRVKNRK